jgi:hypothetical protein
LDKTLQVLKDLKVSYRKCFESEDGVKVLKDLYRVCYMDDTTFNKDPYIAAFQEGIRSVALHIKQAMEENDGLQEEREG